MKRRQFLLTTLGLAGGAVSSRAFATVKPCPPAQLTVGTQSVSTACNVAGTPEWFSQLPERVWVEIAAGSARSDLASWQRGARFDSVVPGSPGDSIQALPQTKLNLEGPRAVFDDWTGGAVDPERKELLLAANGGHAGYPGNEVYALQLGESLPRWSRIVDPTPAAYWRADKTAGGPASYDDFVAPATYGRIRARHGWNRTVFANGRIWLAAQDAYTYEGGESSPSVWSFDRDGFETGRLRKEWSISENPWTYHGNADLPDAAANYQLYSTFPSVYDPNSRKVWSFSNFFNYSAGTGQRCWTVEVDTGRISTFFSPFLTRDYGGAWGVAAYDLPSSGRTLAYFPIMAASGSGVGTIAVWDLQANTVQYIQPVNKPIWKDPRIGVPRADGSYFQPGHGAVFHKASRAIFVYDPFSLGSKIRMLRIPSDPYKGTYEWQDIVPGSGTATPVPCINGVNSKFNIIEDMGNGQSCLVVASRHDAPAYVFKLPIGGL